jgi:hypothetical protein
VGFFGVGGWGSLTKNISGDESRKNNKNNKGYICYAIAKKNPQIYS